MTIKDNKTFFDDDFRNEKLNELGNPLALLDRVVDWNIFRKPISDALAKTPKGQGGRPGYDYIMMFKILVIQKSTT